MGRDEANLDPAAIAVGSAICPRCGAAPTRPCLTSGGNPVSYGAHSARTKPFYLAWRAGYWHRKVEQENCDANR